MYLDAMKKSVKIEDKALTFFGLAFLIMGLLK